MKKLVILVAAAVLALSGCAADTTATFDDGQVQTVLFGEKTQAALGALGFTAASNTLAKTDVADYLSKVASSDVIDPATCANSTRPLLLADKDAASTDTFYELPSLATGKVGATVQARLFATDAAAEAFVVAFHEAVAACPAFTDTRDGDTIEVAVTASEPDPDGRGFFFETTAGTPEAARTFRTYIVRQGNLAIAVQGTVTSDEDDTLLVNTTSAIFAQAQAAAGAE